MGVVGWFEGGEWGWEGYWGDVVGKIMGLVVVVAGVVVGVGAQLVFARWLGRARSRGEVCFWSGYVCQVWLSWESVLVVVGRGSVRGCSTGIWYVGISFLFFFFGRFICGSCGVGWLVVVC